MNSTCTKTSTEFAHSRNVAIVVFYDENLNIAVQERGDHSKLGEKYGFWGGRIEEGETAEVAMKRELREELGYVPKTLKYWKDYSYFIKVDGPYNNWRINCHVFISPITAQLRKTNPKEGAGIVYFPVDQIIENGDRDFGKDSTSFMKDLKVDLANFC